MEPITHCGLRYLLFLLQDKKPIDILKFRDNTIDIWWYKDVTTTWHHRSVTSDSFQGVWCQIIIEWYQSMTENGVFPLGFSLQTILKVSEFTYLWWHCGNCLAVAIMRSFSTSQLRTVWLPVFLADFF